MDIKQKLNQIKHKLQHLFRQRRWPIAITAGAAAVVVIIAVLLIGGQQDIGAQEAGQQISKLTQNIRNRYQTRTDFWGLSTAEVIRQKMYPLSMTAEGGKLIGYFGNEVQVGADASGAAVMPTVRRFVIAYNNLNRKQCLALGTYKFTPDFWLGISGMTIETEGAQRLFDWSSKELALPATEDIVGKICRSQKNNIIFHFE